MLHCLHASLLINFNNSHYSNERLGLALRATSGTTEGPAGDIDEDSQLQEPKIY